MDNLFDFIIDPLSYAFMQRALLMALAIAVVCSIFSCFLVLKGWALMGDAVSHAILPGLVIAYVAGFPLAVGAFGGGLFCALATGYLDNHSRVKSDAVMGIVFSGLFAIGLVMMSKIQSDIHLMHVLFGNILGLSWAQIIQSIALSVITAVILWIKRKDFMLYCFDPNYAQVIGMPVKIIYLALLSLLSMTIVSALQASGIILVVAMLIAPGAIGFMLSKSFGHMLMMALLASIISCISGVYISFYIDGSPAALIVLLQFILFLLALFYRQIKSYRIRKAQ